MEKGRQYVIVSPAKDEETRIATTIRAVLNQTVRPVRWIIVDDASSDNTAVIARGYAEQNPWITVLSLHHTAGRDLGNAEIRAFAAGYEVVKGTLHDFVVKLDCDLDLPHDYFAQLFAEFQKNPKLGIAAGVCMETTDGRWQPMRLPRYHASGASKMVRSKCFEEIGGFVLYRGWDTIDEIKAQRLGWDTRHFDHFGFYHLRKEGSAMGYVSTSILHGEAYYRSGGGFLFFVLKALHRVFFGKPFLLDAFFLVSGYFKAAFSEAPGTLGHADKSFYRQLLNNRIKKCVLRGFRRENSQDPSPALMNDLFPGSK